MEVEQRHVTASLQIRLQGNCCIHHFTGGRNQTMACCRPAGKFRPRQSKNDEEMSGKRLLKSEVSLLNQSRHFVVSQLDVQTARLYRLTPACFWEVNPSHLPLFFLLPPLTCSEDVSAWSANDTPQTGSRIQAPDNAGSPRTRAKSLCLLHALRASFSVLVARLRGVHIIFLLNSAAASRLLRCKNIPSRLAAGWFCLTSLLLAPLAWCSPQ